MTRLRIRAALIDLGLIVGWAVIVFGSGALLKVSGLLPLTPLELNLAGAAAVLVPSVALLTITEGGRYQASPGKQWSGLRVRCGNGRQLGYGRALVRNLLKIAPPWLLGHAALLVVLTARPPLGADVWVLAGVALVVPLVYVVTLLVADHRALYDLATDTQVVAAAGARRAAGQP